MNKEIGFLKFLYFWVFLNTASVVLMPWIKKIIILALSDKLSINKINELNNENQQAFIKIEGFTGKHSHPLAPTLPLLLISCSQCSSRGSGCYTDYHFICAMFVLSVQFAPCLRCPCNLRYVCAVCAICTMSAIGHFRVPLCLCFKASLSAKPFLWKWLWFAWEWNCMQNSFSYERFRT